MHHQWSDRFLVEISSNPPSIALLFCLSTNDYCGGNKYSPNMVLIFSLMFSICFSLFHAPPSQVSRMWCMASSSRAARIFHKKKYTKICRRFAPMTLSTDPRKCLASNWISLLINFSKWQDVLACRKKLMKMCFMSFNILHTCWCTDGSASSSSSFKNQRGVDPRPLLVVLFQSFSFFFNIFRFEPPQISLRLFRNPIFSARPTNISPLCKLHCDVIFFYEAQTCCCVEERWGSKQR